jgi:hypothetical protein
MGTGVVTVLHVNDTGGPTDISRDVGRVRTYPRRRIYGQSGSKSREGSSLAPNYVAKLHLPGGGVRLSGKEACRDGRSDTISRRRPSGSAAAARRVLKKFRASMSVGSGYGDMPSHYRHPLSLLPNVRECGPGYVRRLTLRNGCLVDARSEEGRARSHVGLLDKYPGSIQRQAEKMRGWGIMARRHER